MDANTYIDSSKVKNFLNIYPNTPDIHTTMKKRTWLQVQTNKADTLASTCRDHLLSTMNLHETKVVTITGEDSKNVRFIPT